MSLLAQLAVSPPTRLLLGTAVRLAQSTTDTAFRAADRFGLAITILIVDVVVLALNSVRGWMVSKSVVTAQLAARDAEIESLRSIVSKAVDVAFSSSRTNEKSVQLAEQIADELVKKAGRG